MPVTPPPAPKSKAEKLANLGIKRDSVEIGNQTKEWKKIKKFRIKNKNKNIIRRVVVFDK